MKKILIACDDRVLTMLYADELGEEGYDIASTAEVTRLVGKLEEENPDLIVVDCRMDRYEKSDLRGALMNGECRVPVILCTDYPSRIKNPEGVPYLVLKNSNFGALKGTLRKALGEEGLYPPAFVQTPKVEAPAEQMTFRFLG